VIICDGSNWLIREVHDYGNFTVTYVGGTTAPTGSARYSVTDRVITLCIPALSATSNSTSFSYSGLPVALESLSSSRSLPVGTYTDNSAVAAGLATATVSNNTSIVFSLNGSTTGWNGGAVTKAMAATCFEYYP
jgi:predicted outer membrane repeat protein